MSDRQPSILKPLLGNLARAICRYPKAVCIASTLLFLLSVAFTLSRLEIHTQRTDLVDSDRRYHRNFLKFRSDFEVRDEIVVVVESENPERNRQFIERLGRRLKTEPELFDEVFYKGDFAALGNHALYFSSPTELEALNDRLESFAPFIKTFTSASNLVSLVDLAKSQFSASSNSTTQTNTSKAFIEAIPALERILTQASDALDRPGQAPSPGVGALFGAGAEAEQRRYITYNEGQIYILSTLPPSASNKKGTIRRLRELVEEIKQEVQGVNVGVTGKTVLEVDEMQQSKDDTIKASILAFLLVALIFVYGFHEIWRPIKATAALVFGLAYTMAYTTASVGHLNILTITFAPILIGLAIDFGVHLISRFEEEQVAGRTPQDALYFAMIEAGSGIFTGCLTTAGAFFAMAFTGFKGVQEMGIITGGGMIVSLIPMMTFLPAMLVMGKNQSAKEASFHFNIGSIKLESLWLSHSKKLIGITLSLTAVAAIYASRVRFDYNLLNLQSKGLPAVEFQQKLIDEAEKSVLFGAIIAPSPEAAIKIEEEVLRLPSVSKVDSMAKYLIRDQTAHRESISEVKKTIAQINFQPPDLHAADTELLTHKLWLLRGYLAHTLPRVQATGKKNLISALESFDESIGNLSQKLNRADLQRATTHLTSYQQALFADLQDTFEVLKRQSEDGLKATDLPPTLSRRFLGANNQHLIQVYPKQDLWQRSNQKQFIQELRQIDPDVTGTPVQLYEYTSLLKRSYEEAALYSLGAIAILVIIHFRRLLAVVLALSPVAIGTLWMVGLMALFDIPFNPANIMTLPLIVGVGVTNGIHILNRFKEGRTTNFLSNSTGKAVLVSALTTISGFGSLITAGHQGITSLGLIMSIGVATCMISSLTFLPASLNILSKKGYRIV